MQKIYHVTEHVKVKKTFVQFIENENEEKKLKVWILHKFIVI